MTNNNKDEKFREIESVLGTDSSIEVVLADCYKEYSEMCSALDIESFKKKVFFFAVKVISLGYSKETAHKIIKASMLKALKARGSRNDNEIDVEKFSSDVLCAVFKVHEKEQSKQFSLTEEAEKIRKALKKEEDLSAINTLLNKNETVNTENKENQSSKDMARKAIEKIFGAELLYAKRLISKDPYFEMMFAGINTVLRLSFLEAASYKKISAKSFGLGLKLQPIQKKELSDFYFIFNLVFDNITDITSKEQVFLKYLNEYIYRGCAYDIEEAVIEKKPYIDKKTRYIYVDLTNVRTYIEIEKKEKISEYDAAQHMRFFNFIPPRVDGSDGRFCVCGKKISLWQKELSNKEIQEIQETEPEEVLW